MNILTLLKCALADLQGIMPEIEPSGDRTHSGWQTITDLEKQISAIENGKKYTVLVAFNQEAVEKINEKNSWDNFPENFETTIDIDNVPDDGDGCRWGKFNFNTYSEAEAFMQGLSTGNGWDEPEMIMIEPQ